jgi:putative transposase
MVKQEHWVTARGCVYNIYYHMVWSTKYRKKLLVNEIDERLKELHIQIANEKGIDLKEQEIMPDHVHLFVSAHPKFSPSQMTKIFKGITAKVLFEEFPELRQKEWRGHLWNPSYYVGTMGDVTKDVIEKYIKMQKEGGNNDGDSNKTN